MHANAIQIETIFVRNQEDRNKTLNSGSFLGIVVTFVSGETKIL